MTQSEKQHIVVTALKRIFFSNIDTELLNTEPEIRFDF